jgi:hypothetical protein
VSALEVDLQASLTPAVLVFWKYKKHESEIKTLVFVVFLSFRLVSSPKRPAESGAQKSPPQRTLFLCVNGAGCELDYMMLRLGRNGAIPLLLYIHLRYAHNKSPLSALYLFFPLTSLFSFCICSLLVLVSFQFSRWSRWSFRFSEL